MLAGSVNLNPLELPSYTIRLKYADGVTPTVTNTSIAQVSSSPNVWDITYNSASWSGWLSADTDANQAYLIEVLGANTTNITRMDNLFKNCTALTNVALFDTEYITSMDGMFMGCTSLTGVPLLYTDRVVNTSNMFNGCVNVTHGALDLYQQASTQATVPNQHSSMFTNCGSNTIPGALELAQIPVTWGGTQPIHVTLRFEVPYGGNLQLCNMDGCNIVSGVHFDSFMGTTTALTSEQLQSLQDSPAASGYVQYLHNADYVELVVEPTQDAITWSTPSGWSSYADIEVTITNTDTSAVSSMQYTQQPNLNVGIEVP